MEIITEGYPKEDKVLLDSITCTYLQEPDCTENREDSFQEITLITRDGGGGKFLHIKTDGWSVTNGEEFLELIKDFSKRVGDEGIMHS